MINFYLKKLRNHIESSINSNSRQKIYYFCVPVHPNLGDQAQYICWLKLFKEWYPDTEIISIPSSFVNNDLIELIQKHICDKDRIFIHSGYLMSDIHADLKVMLNVIPNFPNNNVTVLPQTINITDSYLKEEVSKVFDGHSHLRVIARDDVSYNNANKLFSKCKVELMPDVVTTLIGTDYVDSCGSRSGVLFCLRNDSEKLYTDKQLDALKNKFNFVTIDTCDTSIVAKRKELDKNREQLIKKTISMFANYQLIITDRYHGTIFSQISNTPVIVLSSTDHKLSSGVNWFPKDIFSQNMYFANTLEEAYDIAVKIIDRKGKEIKNPPYFLNNYYSKPL